MFTAEQEIKIEKMRQILCSMHDFEPYTAFKRLDRYYQSFLDKRSLCKFLQENGFRELEQTDLTLMINYFDQTGSGRLNFTDFI